MRQRAVALALIVTMLFAASGCISVANVKRTPIGNGRMQYEVGLIAVTPEASGPVSLLQTGNGDALQLLPLFQFSKDDNRMERFAEIIKNVQEMDAMMNNPSGDQLGFMNYQKEAEKILREVGRNQLQGATRLPLSR
ncbi:MAG: hypothetical protein GY851_08805 [bacterium]|nr:hypothetical protein [bacterium]